MLTTNESSRCGNPLFVDEPGFPINAFPYLYCGPTPERDDAIPFYYADYLSLVDWTGRVQRDDKRGSIAGDLPPILDRLGFDERAWFKTMKLH